MVLLLIIVAVLHVHLNMFTVENPANPSFWIRLSMEMNPFGGGKWRILGDILMMGVQCFVTFIFAIFMLKWKKIKVWLLSYLICVVLYLITLQVHIVPTDNAWNQVYDRIYEVYDRIYEYGGAFKYCFIFSILQIMYITIYMLVSSFLLRKEGGHRGII